MINNGSLYVDLEVKGIENEDLWYIFTEVKLKWSADSQDQMDSSRLLQMLTTGTVRDSVEKQK